MRLATFNILNGRSPQDAHIDADRLARAVKSLDADVLALQEVDRDQPRSQSHDLTVIAAEAMGAVDQRFVAALVGTPGSTWQAATGEEQPGSAVYGIALLSRFPVSSWQVLRLPAVPFRVPMMFPGPGRPRLVHDEPRVAMAGAVQTPYGEVTVVTTHLSFLPGWNVLQLRLIRRAFHRRDGALVLMGDLNMGSRRAARTSGLTPLAELATFPVAQPVQQLDHVLARDLGRPVLGQASVELPVSDHRALIVDL